MALALALEAALPTDWEAEEALDAAELLMLASSDDRELAAEPVAVDSTDWMDEARLLVSEVMELRADERPDEAEDRRDEISEPMEEVRLAAELAREDISELILLMSILILELDDSWA